jgi:Carboxypeptidase regulatory-like domain
MRRVALFFCALLLLSAQNQKGDYSIRGTVVNSRTGEPVKGALVTLWKMPSPESIPESSRTPAGKTALAGIGGEFEFTGLSEGQYNLTPQKPGFAPHVVEGGPESSPFIKLTASITGVQAKLAPLGAIEGKVVDQDNEPVRGVSVSALEINILDGVRYTTTANAVVTNDLGLFRIWNLSPGKYYVKALGKSGGTFVYVGDNANRYDSSEGFGAVYSGGARDLDSATPVVIAAGTQARADCTVSLEPAFKVRGHLQNFSPYETVKFEILQGDEDVSAGRVALNGTTGAFEIHDVINGSYTLLATQGQKARGQMTINVKGADVDSVALALLPPVTVHGVVRLVGPAPEPRKPASGTTDFEPLELPPSCGVSLRAPGRALGMGHGGQATENGQFTIERVYAGEYRVTVSCTGGYPSSALSGSSDLLATPRITVEPGVAPAPIEIALKPGGGTLQGKIVINPKPQQGGVLLVPTFLASTGPVFDALDSEPGSADEPDFEFPDLAPGDYVAYFFATAEPLEFRSPAFLQSLTGGVKVHIEDGKTTEIAISTSVAK